MIRKKKADCLPAAIFSVVFCFVAHTSRVAADVWTQDTDVDFNSGTTANTIVNGNSVKLAPNGGSEASGAIDLTSACTGTGISGSHPNCNLAGATYNYTTVTIPSSVIVTVTGATALKINATGAVNIN